MCCVPSSFSPMTKLENCAPSDVGNPTGQGLCWKSAILQSTHHLSTKLYDTPRCMKEVGISQTPTQLQPVPEQTQKSRSDSCLDTIQQSSVVFSWD